MAIGRLSMKVGKAGKASAHSAYIARTGRYANRLRRGEQLIAHEAGNMPAWAKADPMLFWEAADTYERSNGTTYREMEIALPRELSHKELKLLVADWVRQEIGDRHAYQWAIHVPKAADGGDQPHVHLMFSERQVDGIERDPDVYFKRFNAKSPEKGGARKGYGPAAGQTLTRDERAAHLKELRSRWEAACNKALAAAGQKKRIDMRSLKDRGVTREPEGKVLPSLWRAGGRDKIIELRAARAELRADRAALRAEIAALPPIIEVPNGRGNITVPAAPTPAERFASPAAGRHGGRLPESQPDLWAMQPSILGQRRRQFHDSDVPSRDDAHVAGRSGGAGPENLQQIRAVPPSPRPATGLRQLPRPLRIRALASRQGWTHTGPTYNAQFRQKLAARSEVRDRVPVADPVRVPEAAQEALRPPQSILPSRKAQQPPVAPAAALPAAPPLGAPQPAVRTWSPRDETSPERRTLMGSILDMTMELGRRSTYAAAIQPVLDAAWKALGDLAPRFQAWLDAILPRQKDPDARAEITEVSSWRMPVKQLRNQFEREGRLPRSPGPRPPQKPGRGGREL